MGIGVRSQVLEFLEEKARKGVSDGVVVTRNVSSTDEKLVSDGEPGETAQEGHDGE